MQLNKALAVNVLVFAVLLVLVVLMLLYPQPETQTVSQGQVPEGEPPTLVGEEEAMHDEAVETRPAPEETPPPPPPALTDRPELHSESLTVDVPVLVRSDGEPLEGAVVSGALIRHRDDGRKETNSMLKDLTYRHIFEQGVTAQDGSALASVKYSEEDEGGYVEFFAYHPSAGTSYIELSLKDIVTGRKALEFDLTKGRTISGRVIEENGEPVSRALVRMYGMMKGISLAGMGNVTDDEGRFSFSGIQYDNTPVLVQVMYPARDPNDPLSVLEQVNNPNSLKSARATVTEKSFDPNTETYVLGDIKLVSNPNQ